MQQCKGTFGWAWKLVYENSENVFMKQTFYFLSQYLSFFSCLEFNNSLHQCTNTAIKCSTHCLFLLMSMMWHILLLCPYLQNDISWWPVKSIHSYSDSSTVTTETLSLCPVVCDASNQPTSGLDRHQSAMVSISPSMTAHIRDGRYHPQGAICSTFHVKVPLPSICSLGAHLGNFVRSLGCSLNVTFCGFGVGEYSCYFCRAKDVRIISVL